ncbi:MAG: VOC family protein [Candidatus Binatia bacterium]|nr:VOC family protein [Candidatus Binatia bacterium]
MLGRVEELHHIQLAMPRGREAEAIRFYEGLLGIPHLPKPPGLDAAGAWFESGALRVHLGVDAKFTAAKKAHPGLLVTGLDDLADRLTDAGGSVVWDDRLVGFRRVYVTDPFGNRIELLEPSDGTQEV